VTKKLIRGGKPYNRFNAQIIYYNNRKRRMKFLSYFAELQQKYLQLKLSKFAIFGITLS